MKIEEMLIATSQTENTRHFFNLSADYLFDKMITGESWIGLM